MTVGRVRFSLEAAFKGNYCQRLATEVGCGQRTWRCGCIRRMTYHDMNCCCWKNWHKAYYSDTLTSGYLLRQHLIKVEGLLLWNVSSWSELTHIPAWCDLYFIRLWKSSLQDIKRLPLGSFLILLPIFKDILPSNINPSPCWSRPHKHAPCDLACGSRTQCEEREPAVWPRWHKVQEGRDWKDMFHTLLPNITRKHFFWNRYVFAQEARVNCWREAGGRCPSR